MKRCGVFAVLACLLAAVLAGCGQGSVPEAAGATTISVDRNGRVTYYCVGDFDREYYSLSELSDMVKGEVARFNGNAGKEGAVSVERVETLPDEGGEQQEIRAWGWRRETLPDEEGEQTRKVLIEYRFDGYSSYNQFSRDFNKGNGRFFFGTVEEALKQGYTLKTSLKSVKDESLKTEKQLKQEGTGKLIISEEKAVIHCPGKVAFLSEGAVLMDERSVDASAAEGTVYILIK